MIPEVKFLLHLSILSEIRSNGCPGIVESEGCADLPVLFYYRTWFNEINQDLSFSCCSKFKVHTIGFSKKLLYCKVSTISFPFILYFNLFVDPSIFRISSIVCSFRSKLP